MQLSQNLGNALNMEVKQIYYRKIFGINIPAFFRYIIQSIATWVYLLKKQPTIIYVQNPPFFAPLAVYIYCFFSGSKMAIDSHTAAFLDAKWMRLFPIFRFVARKAILNTCHNYKNLEILKNWKIEPAMVAQFSNPKYDLKLLNKPMQNIKINKKISESEFPIMMVNRFADDDDCETVIETAKLMPNATFFLTGDPSKARLSNITSNVILTGYLEHNEFLKLMYRCKVILAFTLRPDTVLWSIREIIALRKPFVTTDSEVLHHYFNDIGFFTKSDAEVMKNRINEALANESSTIQKMELFLQKDNLRWEKEINDIKNFLAMR